jgi:hypothetical protein
MCECVSALCILRDVLCASHARRAPQLLSLDIADNLLGAAGVEALVPGLQSLASLVSLDIRYLLVSDPPAANQD